MVAFYLHSHWITDLYDDDDKVISNLVFVYDRDDDNEEKGHGDYNYEEKNDNDDNYEVDMRLK